MTRFLLLSKTGLVCLTVFVFLFMTLPLIDPDYYWHLKTGEYIVRHAALPAGDVFSFTRAGQPWVLHEWLFEVLLYEVFAAAGVSGVKALAALLAVAAMALVFTASRRIAGPAAAWTSMVVGAFAFATGLSPRPQLLTYACFALYLALLLRFKYAQTTRQLFVLPLVMLAWVNVHGAYAIGIVLLLLFAACEWLAWWCQPVRDPDQKRRLVRLSQVTCLVVLASLVNPGAFERWLYPFQVIGMTVNQAIQEWQSPDFHQLGPKIYLGLVLLFLVSSIYATRKPDFTELALPLFFAIHGCISMRHVPLAVLALVPFTALALSRGPLSAMRAGICGLKPVRWYLARRLPDKELGGAEHMLNWIVACAVIFGLPTYVRGLDANSEQPRRMLVEGAADFVAAHGIRGNLFNGYNDGGYLIYRLAPYVKVAVDGRADIYGDRFIQEYLHVYQGGADWRAKFDRLAVDAAVLPLDAPIRQLLLENGRFRELYRDKHYSVLQRAVARDPLRVADRQDRQTEGARHDIPD